MRYNANDAGAAGIQRRMTSTIIPSRALCLAAAFWILSCAPAPSSPATAAPPGSLFAAESEHQWQLPSQLAEISGLALSTDGRLFAHDDERAIIYELDAATGRVIKRFTLGEPVETGDFEGLAIAPDGAFHLITSRGILYTFREGDDGSRAPFETTDTGLRRTCEIEGLTFSQVDDSLIIACKSMNDRAMRDTIYLFAWRADSGARPWLSLPEASLTARARVDRFRPSSLEIDPASGRILLLSGNDGALVELSRDGEVLAARALGAGHRQAEGVTVTTEGALIISDEAAGGQATLTRYARVP
jgi:uncharacterized protein YjiK